MATATGRKFSDFDAIEVMPEAGLLLVHDGSGVKTITFEGLKAYLGYENAGAHNSIYRGKYLGSEVTEEQYAEIEAGTFNDLYIGDYWTIGGFNWRIAAFDYYLTTGDTACSTHHVVIVPDTNLYSAQMEASNITTNGYTGSAMRTTHLASAKTTIKNAFGEDHILTHRLYLCNASSNGRPSGEGWFDADVELMTEMNVYGTNIFAPVSDGSNVPGHHEIDKSQYPLFAMNPYLQTNRQTYWLRDIVTAAHFARASSDGYAAYSDASASLGVRPAFCLS